MKKVLILGGAVALLALGFGTVAGADNSDNASAPLVHVGLNPATCTTVPGTNSGVVNARYNATASTLTIDVVVHGALPNKTYDVDKRCVSKIGSLKTDGAGNGAAHITLPAPTPPSTFYVDISVFGGGGGAGGYGDTFIAGPFNVNGTNNDDNGDNNDGNHNNTNG